MDGQDTTQRYRRPGRPPHGANLVASLANGSSLAKSRLEAILRTLDGEWTVEEACDHLAIGRTAFNKMRTRFLEDATALLEPRRPGPIPRIETIDAAEVDAMRDEIRELKIDVFAAQTREDLALAATPSAPTPSGGNGQGKKRKYKRRRKRGSGSR